MGATALVFAGRPLPFRQVASRATQCQIAQGRCPALRTRHDVFDVKSDACGSLEQSTVFTSAAGASLD